MTIQPEDPRWNYWNYLTKSARQELATLKKRNQDWTIVRATAKRILVLLEERDKLENSKNSDPDFTEVKTPEELAQKDLA